MNLRTFAICSFVACGAGTALGQYAAPTHKFLAEGGDGNDRFGTSVSLWHNLAAIGTPGNGFYDPHRSVRVLNLATGEEVLRVFRPDSAHIREVFGTSVGVWGDRVVVGSPELGHYGAAYLFDSNTGELIARLLSDTPTQQDGFGISVSIHEGVVAVGANDPTGNDPGPGAVYLFDAETGARLGVVAPEDGVNWQLFGSSIDLDGNTLVVGSPYRSDNGPRAGAAYIFDVATQQQIVKVLPLDGAEDDNFGSSVAVSDGIVIAGAWGDDDFHDQMGSAYLFDASTGQQITKLLPTPRGYRVLFGHAVDISGGLAVVTAPHTFIDEQWNGAAYTFDVQTGLQVARLAADDRRLDHELGLSVALSSGHLLVGTPRDNDQGGAAGAVYRFNTGIGSCYADLAEPAGVLNYFDLVQYTTLYAQDSGAADIAAPFGTLNFFDVAAYIESYLAGCP